jgi:cytochrome c oxidase assembly protein subunit 15
LDIERKQKLILLTFLICVLMGFKLGWKTVVDCIKSFQNNHSHAGCIINCSASIDCYLYRKKNNKTLIFNQKFNWILAGSLGLNIIQIVLGTTVREHVDIVSETGAPEIM